MALNESLEPADIKLWVRGGPPQTISHLNAKVDPLHFTLMFPKGNSSWHSKMLQTKTTENQKDKNMSPSQYYRHLFQVFKDQYNGILRFGKLLSEFACTVWFKIESSRLMFQRTHQKQLRAESYKGLEDALNAQEDPTQVGDRVILASSHVGSPRW